MARNELGEREEPHVRPGGNGPPAQEAPTTFCRFGVESGCSLTIQIPTAGSECYGSTATTSIHRE